MRQKQIEESKNLIMEGFFSLLSKKEYGKISMSEIAEESMVTRMTLYRHFKNKDEILKYLIMNMVDLIKENYDQLENRNVSNLLLIRNRLISSNKYLKVAMTNKEAEPIVRKFIIHGRSLVSEHFGLDNIKNRYVSEFVIGGIEAITTNWILGGMKESPEMITHETMEILQLLTK